MYEMILLPTLADLAVLADEAARRSALDRYRRGKARETLRRHHAAITLFQQYLAEAGLHGIAGMEDHLELWADISFGLVAGFQEWLLRAGYAIGSVNVRLSTITTYCKLACQAGHLPPDELVRIQSIHGLGGAAARNLDEKRERQRVGQKKASPTAISETHVSLIKRQLRARVIGEQDSQVARDLLLFCLLVDHGLRCGEVAALEIRHIDLTEGRMTFYRHKVHKIQSHQLTADTLEAMQLYLKLHQPAHRLFHGNPDRRTGKLAEVGITTRALNNTVRRLGKMVGLVDPPLSPHDLRHRWATTAIRKGSNLRAVQQAGGWSSPTMALRYAEEQEIANAGINL